jgi:hypothetical protein
MSCKSYRPTHVTCADCPATLPVKSGAGRLPERCDKCKAKHRYRNEKASLEYERLHGEKPITRSKVGPFALGPDRPEGLTPKELDDVRARRAVRLYTTEPELTVSTLAERLGVDDGVVSHYLDKAGVKRRRHGDRLPAGPPVP